METHDTQINSSIKLNQLGIGYRDSVLVENIQLEAYPGEFICIIGPNGCGKSTLLKTVTGIIPAVAGAVHINGENIHTKSNLELAQLYSLVLTEKIQTGNLTVFDLVSMGRHPYTNWLGTLSGSDIEIIDQCIEQVHLEKLRDRKLYELSDGELQRAQIAKALAQDTQLIILDEPTAHLDLPNRVEIMNLLAKLTEEKYKTILLTTHELDLALQTADKIWLMTSIGNIITGAPEDLVINESFEQVFSGKQFSFNKLTGSFKIKRSPKSDVYFIASTPEEIWTKNALERAGFYCEQTKGNYPEIRFLPKTKSWQINHKNNLQEVNSIAELLCWLKKERN